MLYIVCTGALDMADITRLCDVHAERLRRLQAPRSTDGAMSPLADSAIKMITSSDSMMSADPPSSPTFEAEDRA